MPVAIPAAFLEFAARSADWARWMQALPRLVASVLAEWSLTVDGPAMFGHASLVVPVRISEGRAAVAKFGFPHPESEFEHLALRDWAGRGAVRLIRADPRRAVLLLERARADRDLTALPVLAACDVVARLYGVLHRPAPPQVARLSVAVADWGDRLRRIDPRGRVPRRLVTQAVGLAADFARDADTDQVLLHTDLHYANVLAADREPWLVIDPKPMRGDPAYEIAPLLWNRWPEVLAADSARTAILDRFYRVVDGAGLDEDRSRAWVIVRELVQVLWALEDAERGRPLDREWITRATTIVKAVSK